MRRGGHLIFSVIDSGVGMEKADIQKLYEKIANPGSENIGLTNVNSRLIMRYGECAGLKILSKKGMGTCISFRISIKEIACSVPHKDTKAHQASKSAVIFQDVYKRQLPSGEVTHPPWWGPFTREFPWCITTL